MTNKKTKQPAVKSTEKKLSQAELYKLWFNDPKSRDVVYGVTDRRKDPWWLKLNDWLLDNQSISLHEKSKFFNSLKLLVNSGVRFIRSLKMLGERTNNVHLSRILNTIKYNMMHDGQSFSDAIAKYPQIFKKAEIKMIYSGEITGKIDKTLNSIATQLEKSIELEMRIKNAMMYPIAVFIAIILAMIVVVTVIVPKFESLFSEFGDGNLPTTTKIIMALSDFFIDFWFVAISMAVGAWIMFNNWKNSAEGQLTWDSMTLNAPLIKKLVSNIQTVRIASNFSTLMHSGVPVTKALRILAEIVPNKAISNAIFNIELKVRKGEQMSECFRQEEVLDRVLAEILEVGEETGQIAEVLEKLGEQYEMEVDSQLKNLTTIIEPLIIIVVGGAVVFMAMAIMGPIFQMQELFTKSV
jgi:MSHA biogenesis protein MshG